MRFHGNTTLFAIAQVSKVLSENVQTCAFVSLNLESYLVFVKAEANTSTDSSQNTPWSRKRQLLLKVAAMNEAK